MPKATVSSATKKFELKTLPEGFVLLKRMSFGQKLERMQLATEQVVRDSGDGRKNSQSMAVDIKMMQRTVTEYEFKHCVVDHNLEHDNGQKMNFADPKTIDLLDPKIGDEISQYIADMNNFEGDEEGDSGN